MTMSIDTDQLGRLKETLKLAKDSLSQCENAYKGLRMFADNSGGIVFCIVQLQQSAAALQEHADTLAVIAPALSAVCLENPEQLELHDVDMNGRP
jgi:hypothetical protein